MSQLTRVKLNQFDEKKKFLVMSNFIILFMVIPVVYTLYHSNCGRECLLLGSFQAVVTLITALLGIYQAEISAGNNPTRQIDEFVSSLGYLFAHNFLIIMTLITAFVCHGTLDSVSYFAYAHFCIALCAFLKAWEVGLRGFQTHGMSKCLISFVQKDYGFRTLAQFVLKCTEPTVVQWIIIGFFMAFIVFLDSLIKLFLI